MATDTEVLKRAGVSCIHTLLQNALLNWADYVTRMPETGKRSVGGQNELSKDTVNREDPHKL